MFPLKFNFKLLTSTLNFIPKVYMTFFTFHRSSDKCQTIHQLERSQALIIWTWGQNFNNLLDPGPAGPNSIDLKDIRSFSQEFGVGGIWFFLSSKSCLRGYKGRKSNNITFGLLRSKLIPCRFPKGLKVHFTFTKDKSPKHPVVGFLCIYLPTCIGLSPSASGCRMMESWLVSRHVWITGWWLDLTSRLM